MADVHFLSKIRTGKVHYRFAALPHRIHAQSMRIANRFQQSPRQPLRFQSKINKARPRDLRLLTHISNIQLFNNLLS